MPKYSGIPRKQKDKNAQKQWYSSSKKKQKQKTE